MGDRANIKLVEKTGGTSIYLYTHWEGHEWPTLLQAALKSGRSRWGDPSYIQRWIITEMCQRANDPTGYGVSVSRQDNEHHVFEVDFEAQKVRKLSRAGFFEPDWEKTADVLQEWTLEDFIQANPETFRK